MSLGCLPGINLREQVVNDLELRREVGWGCKIGKLLCILIFDI